MDAHYRIRPADPADAASLSVLERRCFSDPWSADGCREALSMPVCFGLIATAGRDIRGYFLARVVAGEAEILNLATIYDIQELAFDRTFAGEIVRNLADEGMTLVEFGQGFLLSRPVNAQRAGGILASNDGAVKLDVA